MIDVVGRLQLVSARKSLEQRPDVIAEFAIADSGLLQNVPGQDIKIKLRRNAKVASVVENRFDQFWVIEDGIPYFGIAQQIHERNAVAARAGERTDNEIEIRGGEACPTICPNHRAFPSRALMMP